MEKEKNTLDKLILIFIIIQPILDMLVGEGIRNNNILSYLGLILRGLLFLIILIYLFINKIDKRFIYYFLIYIILALSYYYFCSDNSIIKELSNILQIFYLPFLILFFNNYKNNNINKKIITIVYLIYTGSLVLTYLLGIGHNVSEIYFNKDGFMGLFYGGNEISNIILCLMPIVLSYTYDSKSYILKIIIYLFTLITIILVGTKTLLIGTIIIVIYALIKYFHSKPHIALIIFTIIIAITMILPLLPVYQNFRNSIIFYQDDIDEELISLENLDNLIFSKRLSYAKNINNIYINSNLTDKMFGIGKTKIINNKDIEIDILDIFYSIGIIGILLYLYMMINILKKTKLKGIYKLSFILLLIVSCIAGHVLLKTMVSFYLSILFLLNKEERDKRIKILVVSNMYPSNTFKSYGIFVKNTEEELIEDGYKVNHVVIHKHKNKLIKLLAYIKLHGLTIIKGIFNNYDYIYIHYISHSSIGPIIVKKCSKDVKLVFNAHGNDVIPDRDFEEKNVIRSNKYLKYAYKVVVPSNYYKNVLHDKYKINNKKIYVFPSGGININLFKSLNKERSKERAGLDTKTNYIGYVSRIDTNKGYDTFIKAIPLLDDLKNTKFIIVGSGDEEDKLSSLIHKYELNDKIIYKKLLAQEELLNIYNSLDIFVFPTYRKSDSLGLVGLEAMSCEIPIVASNNYGPTDYVIDSINGFYFKPQDEVDLAKVIHKVYKLSDKELKELKINERKTALKYASDANENILKKVFK